MQNKENHILDLSGIHARGILFNHIEKLRTVSPILPTWIYGREFSKGRRLG